jgi:hypothetical protein
MASQMVSMIGKQRFQYRVFGIYIESNVSLEYWLGNETQNSDLPVLTLSLNWQLQDTARLEEANFVSPVKTRSGAPFLFIFSQSTNWIMRVTDVGSYLLSESEIQFCPISENDLYLCLQHLFSNVIAFWLEQRGIRTLHGSAVSLAGHSVAFLAESTAGKSTLSAALLSAGACLLSDDLIAVKKQNDGYWMQPSFPRTRLKKASIKYYLENLDGDSAFQIPGLSKYWVRVGPGEKWCFESTPQLAEYIFILHRLAASDPALPVTIKALSPTLAVSELIRYSFIAFSPVPLGFAPERLTFWAGMVNQAKVFRLEYPSGLDNLPRVCSALNQVISGETTHS